MNLTSAEFKNSVGAVPTAPVCAFTVDVEDWYQSSFDFDSPISDRVVRNVERVVALLDDFKIKGTFFVQGLVAKKFPNLLRQLVADGHEIQSHGHTHRPLFQMNLCILRRELEAARKAVEDACGTRVNAFRAPDFSILSDNLWALDVLVESGFTVDSSIFPMRMARYGIRGWKCAPHHLSLRNGAKLLEAPVAIWDCGKLRVPVAGGGYFRLLPMTFLCRALKMLIAQQRPAIIYCHPYEFNPTELEDYRGKVSSRLILAQSFGRAFFVERMRRLLETFRFGRFDEVLKGCKPEIAEVKKP